jgi:hypothetical protein
VNSAAKASVKASSAGLLGISCDEGGSTGCLVD